MESEDEDVQESEDEDVQESEDEDVQKLGDKDVQQPRIIESDGPVIPVIPELSFEEELVRLQNQDYGMMTTDEDIWSADA
jgi:hypothetical protein